MNTLDVITVGVASYNRPKLLKRAIQSAVSQTQKNLEILISDNGSSNPEVRAVIDEFSKSDARIRCIFHPDNRGPCFNFRNLLNEAKGKYFIWLADDDYWSPDYLESLLVHARQTGAALTYGRAEVVDIDIAEDDRIAKEMRTSNGAFAAMTNFVRFDSDSIFYGLFITATGKKLQATLSEWRLPKAITKGNQFLEYNFISYVFIFGLLTSGGFCNASGIKTTHYISGRIATGMPQGFCLRHLMLLFAYVLIHLQMIMRFAYVALVTRSTMGLILSPMLVLYLFVRRMKLIISPRLRRIFRG